MWIINLLLYIGQHDHLPQKQVLWRKMNISGTYDLKGSAHLQPRPHSAVICKMLLIGPGETALNPMYTFLKMSLQHILHMMPLWLPKEYYNYIMWPVNQTRGFRKEPQVNEEIMSPQVHGNIYYKFSEQPIQSTSVISWFYSRHTSTDSFLNLGTPETRQ